MGIDNNVSKNYNDYNDYKLVFVIGNGFDLNLGLKTSYKNYMDSGCFKDCAVLHTSSPKDCDGINLFDYLIEKGLDKDNWLDLEKELADLVMSQTELKLVAGELDKRTFSDLKDSLCTYLRNIKYDINPDSIAIKLLKILNKNPFIDIISFNYTDLNQLETIKAPIHYVHGSLLDNSIILGFQDALDIDPSYAFMIKTFSQHYKSHNVREKLLDADEIIFFGHSLGEVDYHYFEDLFKRQSQPEKANQKLILRIFTKDEKSRINILLRLRDMNEKRTDLLYDLCDFRIYRTDEDMVEIEKYLEELDIRSQMKAGCEILKNVPKYNVKSGLMQKLNI